MRVVVVVACLAGCGRIGFGELGGLGDGGLQSDATDGATATSWRRVVAYADTTCAERAGNVYCWGDNSAGQLGMAAGGTSLKPVLIELPAGEIDDLSVGTDSGCAIVEDALYCWGALGTPQAQAVPLAASATKVSVGHGFQCVIAGDAYCWGVNGIGQLGTSDLMNRNTPSAVVHSQPAFVAIRAGDDHACALDGAGAGFCWGHNDDGAIGLPSAMNSAPTPVTQNSSVTSLPLIAGWHTCARTGPTIRCWGEGDHGELGDGLSNNTNNPVTVTNLSSPTFLATGGGPSDGDASCAIDGGVVKCWGNGFFGRLGQGTANPSATPIAVVGLPSAPATEVAIGYDHACAAVTDGSLWCWGRGDTGQLGDDKGTSSMTPVPVVTP